MEALSEISNARDHAEVTISGRAISPGVGIGHAWVVGDILKRDGTPDAVSADKVECELARLNEAFEATLFEIEESASRIEFEFDASLAGIFRAHAAMLRDLFASGEFERELRASMFTAETVVRRIFKLWYQKFESLPDETFRERADDVLDLGRSIIRRLTGAQAADLNSIPKDSVLVVDRLLPSDVVRLPKKHVSAIAVESLGQGSHAALLAREKNIPTITEIPGILSQVQPGIQLVVDGYRGGLIISPRPATQAEFEDRRKKWQATLVRCKDACRRPAVSLDGKLVRVEANIGAEGDVEMALDNGADGVGLLRIEQLYFARGNPPTEQELFTELKQLIAPLGEKPVTVRLLDVGGDKPLPFLRLPATSNPVLGRRGVRLLLDYSQLVRTQLGAILSLANEQKVQILVPMVTLVEDARRMREAFDTMCADRKISVRPEFGVMVETPAAALEVTSLLKYADFLCVGTNDLTQYTLAAARDDAAVNDYYIDDHESILRLLAIILADAKERQVTLCGELASRESSIPRLLQMGFNTLSVAPTAIPTTKATIRGVDTSAPIVTTT